MSIREEIEKICRKWSLQDPYRDGYFDDIVTATITEFEKLIDEKLDKMRARHVYTDTFQTIEVLKELKEELKK